jgi:hypothetical protein
MVKTRVLFLAAFLILISGCGVFVRSEKAHPQVLQVARGRLGGEVSLARAADSLVAVYSDWETTGLYEVEIPVADQLPSAPPPAQMIDRIDIGPPLAASFGEHALISSGDTVTVLYLARAAEDKLILKLASHAMDASGWTLDVVEPPGDPVAVLPAGQGRLDLFWAAGSLLHMSYPGSGPVDSLVDPFTPAGRAGEFLAGSNRDEGGGESSATRGVTVYDSISHALVMLRWNGFAFETTRLDGAGPVNSSLMLADGRVAVLSWNPSTRRLEMLVKGQDASQASRTLVTLSAGTSEVALLPSPARAQSSGGSLQRSTDSRVDRLLFLYDDVKRVGGRLVHELSLLTPGAGLGLGARKYRRVVLLSGMDPIDSFSAIEVGETLYVLVRQDGVKLLQWKLPG